MAEWALLKSGVIANVIVTKDDDHDFAHEYVAYDDNDFDEAVSLAGANPHPGVGWVRKGQAFVPPEVLVVSKDTITGNGSEASTVTYTDNRPNPPATIKGSVNGTEVTLDLASGTGALDVTSANPGDNVLISFGSVATTIGVK
jgi:hypothetical protein